MSKRGSTDLSGILAIDKPVGITSHDVVYAVRKATGEKRVGHCGTLDPLASGLMLVCVGPATRLSNYLMARQKTYQARIAFGAATNTDDSEGELICTAPVPAVVAEPGYAQEFLNTLVGKHLQVPPAFSAIKKDGVRSYQAARRGEELDLEAREIEVMNASILAVNEDFWDVEFTVSKGTYIRALARDIGKQLGTCSHLAALRRTSCGDVGIDTAISLDQLSQFARQGSLVFLDPIAALGLPVLELDASQAKAVGNGMRLAIDGLTISGAADGFAANESANLLALTYDSKLVAIYQNSGSGNLRSKVVIPGGVTGGAVKALQSVGSVEFAKPANPAISIESVESAKPAKLPIPIRITGKVSHGAGRGKQLGFATANIQQNQNTAQPDPGVYACYCTVDGQRYKAAVSVGEPPTFANLDSSIKTNSSAVKATKATKANAPTASLPVNDQLIEPHLLDFSGDLYNKKITLEFIYYLRPMQTFPNQEALIAAVQNNIAQTRELL